MKLDNDINYIVSGLERSGTSMLMQILNAAEMPIGSDDKRPPDQSNPKGYYELEGGKIINKLIDGTLSLDKFKGKFIKKLINERKNTGIHNIIWRGKNYRSEIVKPGLYLYKLEIKSEKGLNEAFYKKMILTD